MSRLFAERPLSWQIYKLGLILNQQRCRAAEDGAGFFKYKSWSWKIVKDKKIGIGTEVTLFLYCKSWRRNLKRSKSDLELKFEKAQEAELANFKRSELHFVYCNLQDLKYEKIQSYSKNWNLKRLICRSEASIWKDPSRDIVVIWASERWSWNLKKSRSEVEAKKFQKVGAGIWKDPCTIK